METVLLSKHARGILITGMKDQDPQDASNLTPRPVDMLGYTVKGGPGRSWH